MRDLAATGPDAFDARVFVVDFAMRHRTISRQNLHIHADFFIFKRANRQFTQGYR